MQPVFTVCQGSCLGSRRAGGKSNGHLCPKGWGLGHTLEKGRAQAWEAWHPHLADVPLSPQQSAPFAAPVCFGLDVPSLWKGAWHRGPHQFSLDEQCQPKDSFPSITRATAGPDHHSCSAGPRGTFSLSRDPTEPSPLQLQPSQALRPSPEGCRTWSSPAPPGTHQTLPPDWRRRGAPSPPPS